MEKLGPSVQVCQPGWSEECFSAGRSASSMQDVLLMHPLISAVLAEVIEGPQLIGWMNAEHAARPLMVALWYRAVKQRMRSVQNIAKITSAMKMVAASKMRVAQVNTERSRGMLNPFLKLLGDLPGAHLRMRALIWRISCPPSFSVPVTRHPMYVCSIDPQLVCCVQLWRWSTT